MAAVSILLGSVFAAVVMLRLADGDFFPFAAAGMFLVLVTRSPRLTEIAAALMLGVALAASYRISNPTADEALSFLGLGSALVLGWRAIRGRSGFSDFSTALILPMFSIVTVVVLRSFSASRPEVYDLYLHRFDESLGVPVMHAMARWLAATPALHAICAVGYRALPLMLTGVLVLHLRRREKFPVFPVLVFGLAGLEGCLLYHVMPAVGPVHVFGPLFASGHWAISFSPVVPLHPAPANSMPSLHLAWALLLLWNVPRENRAAVWGAACFLVLMTLATLGLGEHYFVDLVVAVPFAVCVQNSCAGRWRSAALNGAITLGWLAYLRWLLPSMPMAPAVAWSAITVSLALPFLSKLRRTEAPRDRQISSGEELLLTNA